jgi:hypothetical protein
VRHVRTITILLVTVALFWAILSASHQVPIIATYRSISRCVQDGDSIVLLTLDASGYCRLDVNRAGNKNAADGTLLVLCY